MPQAAEQYDDLTLAAARVIEDGERVKMKVGDREVALISLDDLEFLEDVENRLDLLEALKGLEECVRDREEIAWQVVRQEIDKQRQAHGL